MKIIILIISAVAASLAAEAVKIASNSTTFPHRNSGQATARMLHVGNRQAQATNRQEGARQVQRLARNAQQKLEFLSGRVSQIEDRIEEDLNGNFTTDSGNLDGGNDLATMEPAIVSTGPISTSLSSVEPTPQSISSSLEEQPPDVGKGQSATDSDGEQTGAKAVSNKSMSSVQNTKTWSAPVIKSVIPESAKRQVPAPADSGEETPSERREINPAEDASEDHSVSSSPSQMDEQSPATASPRSTDPVELDLDAPPAHNINSNTNANTKLSSPRYSGISDPKASHRVATGGETGMMLGSDWNPNQNHNYFMELNAKNHAPSSAHNLVAASQPAVTHYAVNKSPQTSRIRVQQLAEKFPNMTITSSESDLANSYSNSHLAQQAQVLATTTKGATALEPPEKRQSSSVKSFSPYRRQQQLHVDYQMEQHNSSSQPQSVDSSSLRPITWPAMASPLQQSQQNSYYSMVQANGNGVGQGKPSGEEQQQQVVYAGQPMAPIQSLGGPLDYQALVQASTGQHFYSAPASPASNSSDLKHRSADGADSYPSSHQAAAVVGDSSSAYAGQAAQLDQPDSNHRFYAQERNMYAQEPQPQPQLQQQQQQQEQPVVTTFGHYQPLPAGQRNDDQSTGQEEQANINNHVSEFELARAEPNMGYQRNQFANNQQHFYQTANDQAQQHPGASDIIAMLRQIQQQRLQQRQQQQAANNPISRAHYATTTQPTVEQQQQPSYRRFSPDLITAYLGGRQQNHQLNQHHQSQQQVQSSQETTSAAASDLIPYTTTSHFQPVYSSNYDSRNNAIYRAAVAAANKANEQAGRQAAQVYLAAAAAAAAAAQQQQQQQSSLYSGSPATQGQLNNNYSQLYASGSAPTYYEPVAPKSSDGTSEVTSHLQRVHHTNNNQRQVQPASSYSQSPFRRNSYLNGLFKPTASSRYYYAAPHLLSPIGLATPVYATPTSYAPAAAATTADALSQLYVAATSPYAVHAPQYAAADPSHQYQQALAAAVAANGLHAHYMTDPDMAESSLVATDGLPASYASPLGSDASSASSDDSITSSSSSSGSGSSSSSNGSSSGNSNSSPSGKGSKTGVGQWTNIAGLLLGILPFGILMASLLPAVTVAGRKKRELELGVKNFAELLKWRAPSQVLDVLLGRASGDLGNATFLVPGKLVASDSSKTTRRRSLDTSVKSLTKTTTTTTTKRPQQVDSTTKPKTATAEVAADERSLSMGNDLSQSAAYTMLAEAVASSSIAHTTTTNNNNNSSQHQQQSNSQTTNLSQTGGVKAKVRKALSALNNFIAAAQNNMKRRHRSGESMDGQWSLPTMIRSKLDNMFNLTDYKRQLAYVVQQRLVAQHQHLHLNPLNPLNQRKALAPAVAPSPASNNDSLVERRMVEEPVKVTTNLSDTGSSNSNSSALNHLEVCLNQFLCRLTVKLNKSLRNSSHLASDSNKNSSYLADSQLERITKKYINQLVEQIEAEHPSVSLSLFKRKPQGEVATPTGTTHPTPLDSLYKSAMRNQCSLVYNCVELLQLERTLSKMKLKFS